MTQTLEISDDLKERLDNHCEDGQSNEELIEELVSMYETEGPSCRRVFGVRQRAALPTHFAMRPADERPPTACE